LPAASQAVERLRAGLTPAAARHAVEHLRPLLGASTLALTDHERTLACDGRGHSHPIDPYAHGSVALAAGHAVLLGRDEMACPPGCPVRTAAAAPVTDTDGNPIGALVAYRDKPSATLLPAVDELAARIGEQLRLGSAELRALRAQINPHFIYNSLNAVAALVRTDPERARELLVDFAGFTRYALGRDGDFVTLAEELRNTERYLELEQARHGDRLKVSLRVAPAVLPAAVPFLTVQPLVENAVRHGLNGGTLTVSITAVDEGATALLTVEDDGTGADPAAIQAAIRGEPRDGERPLGLNNVDSRLRRLFGEGHGLVVETAPGAGTRVTVRVPLR
jgi:two-component system LytT family sensor kinase